MKKIILTLLIATINSGMYAQEQFEIDTSRSIVNWMGSNLFKFNKHTGTVKFTKGILYKKDGKFTGGDFTIDMNTITNTDGKYNEMLVDHLKNQDFFDVKKHPSASLKITKVVYRSDANLDIQADLTIKGITHSITYEARLEGNKMYCEFIIDRTRWKVNYESKSIVGSIKDDIISDAISFKVDLFWN